MKVKKERLMVWCNQINRQVFNNKIDLAGLKFRNFDKDHQNPNARAWYYPAANRIDLISKEHNDVFEIFHTLAHELIHVYQRQVGFDYYHLNHGGKFFRYYKRKICDMYEIQFNKEF